MQVDSLLFQKKRLGDRKEFAKLKKLVCSSESRLSTSRTSSFSTLDRCPTLFSFRPVDIFFFVYVLQKRAHRPVDIFAFTCNLFSLAGLL